MYRAKVVQQDDVRGVLGAEHLFAQIERLAECLFGFGRRAAVVEDEREVVQRSRQLQIVIAQLVVHTQ